MRAELISFDARSFSWVKATMGYRWKDLAYGDKLLVLDVPPNTNYSPPGKDYFPFRKQPALFRVFAAVETKPEDILAFAKEYGSLSTPAGTLPNVDLNESKREELIYDFYYRINKEIYAMREVINLWSLAQSQDLESVSRCFSSDLTHLRDKPDPTIYYFPEYLKGEFCVPVHDDQKVQRIASKETNSTILDIGCRGDVISLAYFVIHQKIESHLKDKIPVNAYWDSERKRPSLRIVPTTLLEAMWVRFAEAIVLDKRFQPCQQCSKWFDISVETARKTKQYCSNACRSKAYRERQEARLLHRGGKTIEEIARELDSDVETVTKWVNAPEEE